MVVASKCLDVERGRILSDSVTSRSGSVGRALTARDSSLRYASCALSAAQNSVPGPGPRRERHGRRVDVQCGDNRIARSPSRVPGARGFAPRAVGYGCRAVPGHLRLRGQKRCCRSAHRSMLTTLSDIATCSFSICIYYLVSTYVLTPMTIPCDIPDQIGAVAAISDFCDNRCYGDPRSWLGAGRENTVNRQPPVPTTEYRRAVHNAGRGIEHPVRSGPRLLRGARESSPRSCLASFSLVLRAGGGPARRGAAGRTTVTAHRVIVFVTAVGIPA